MKITIGLAIILLSSATRLPLNESSNIEGRIIGGEKAKSGEFKYQVGLSIGTEWTSWCGGSLISKDWVLTAAHCLYGQTFAIVYLGGTVRTSPDQQRTSTQFYVHERYDPSIIANDIALLKLSEPVELNDLVQPAELPRNNNANYVGETVVASGWGKTSDYTYEVATDLNYIYWTVVDNTRCAYTYGNNVVKNTNICMDSDYNGTFKSTCTGDSGGPLVLAGTTIQIGLTSYGAAAGCEKGHPIVFTRVASYLRWIDEKTGMTQHV